MITNCTVAYDNVAESSLLNHLLASFGDTGGQVGQPLGGLPAIDARVLLYDGSRLVTAPPSLNATLLALKHLVSVEEVLDLREPVL